MELNSSRNGLKESLRQEIQTLRALVIELASLFPGGKVQAEHWFKVLETVSAHLDEDRCRIAVVGTVKSGKSTLINAILGQDILKRGAGIITAMITRIEPGSEPRACLVFKDWEEINGEINRALSFFPSPLLLERQRYLDLRRPEDRDTICKVLNQVEKDRLLSQDSLDQNYILLSSYLEGYDQLKDKLEAGQQRLELTNTDTEVHQQLVGNEAEAIFLQDVLLTLPFSWPAQGLELGDCQGSDSPIPQHLAQVQNYLLKSDLLLYVISSRVGLRQADYRFLADIKRMRLWEQTLFILNLDLSEHENRLEVERLLGRLRRELSVFQAEAPIFAFSALDHLLLRLLARGATLTPRDQGKLATWEQDLEITSFSRQEAERFERELQRLLSFHQSRLLLTGSLAQVQAVAQGIRENAGLQYDLLGQDVEAIQQAENRLAQRRQPLEGLLHSLSQTLQGTAQDLKRQLRGQVDSFFDSRYGEVGPAIFRFIEAYREELDRLQLSDSISAFMPALYILYQDFQQQFMTFLTEEINLRILEFVRRQEDRLEAELTKVVSPLLVSLQDALSLYYQEMANLGVSAAVPTLGSAAWSRPAELQPPLFSLELTLGWKQRGEALILLGANLVTLTLSRLKRLWRRSPAPTKRERLRRSLSEALGRIKDQTMQETQRYLVDYAERLKFQYLYPLIDYLGQEQEKSWRASLKSLFVDLDGLKVAIQQQEGRKEDWRRRLQGVLQQEMQIETALARLREAAERATLS
ncbi:MAG: dynamin family protein [Deltaproteobacteria bacterium]|nr:dynamin family protein [Deltaproteobacteria bacterium]